eukprot:CCRYP_016646-RB/>CCRYP_016646-RB protein AED:0.12 eAED:0.13 QI:0/0.75/0.8/1/0.5/0.4/5/1908/296
MITFVSDGDPTLGFTPNMYSTDVVDFGLWSFEGPDGACVSHRDAFQDFSWAVSVKTSMTWSWFINSDISWTTSRIFAITSFFFGTFSFVTALRNTCLSEPWLVDVLIYTSTAAMLCEASKLGLFFGSNLCISPDYWYNSSTDKFTGSKECSLGQSAFVSIGSIASYFISVIIGLGFACRSVDPRDDIDYYDEKSLQSWMHNDYPGSQQQEAPYGDPFSQQQDNTTTTDNSTPRQRERLEVSERTGISVQKSARVGHNSEEEEYDEFGDLDGARIIRSSYAHKRLDDMSVVSWDSYA